MRLAAFMFEEALMSKSLQYLTETFRPLYRTRSVECDETRPVQLVR